MCNRILKCLLFCFIFYQSNIILFAKEELTVKIEKITERVYLCKVKYTEDQRSDDFFPVIVSKDGLIIVDTPMYPAIAVEMKKQIIKELGRSDFIYLVNTHYHWDHTGGNQAFAGSKIIGSEYVPIDMKEYIGDNFAGFINERREFYAKRNDKRTVELLNGMEKDFVATPPTITFKDQKIITLSDMTLVLYRVGIDGAKPSRYDHTRSDIFLYIPEEKALFVGDVYFNKEWIDSFPEDQLKEKFNGFMQFFKDKNYEIKYVFYGHILFKSKE